MSGNEQSQEPGKLEFKPDYKQLARLARFRRLALLITLGLSIGALVMVIMIQPRWNISHTVPYQLNERPDNSGAVVSGSETMVSGIERGGFPVADDGLTRVLKSAMIVYAAGDTVIAQWRRAEGLVLYSVVRADNVDEVLRRIEIARMLGDSARGGLERMQQELDRLRDVMTGAVKDKVQISSVYRASCDFSALVKEEMADRLAWLDAYERAVRALGAGDEAEFEVKGNVAGGYLRKCETRQRRLLRTKMALDEVLQRFRGNR